MQLEALEWLQVLSISGGAYAARWQEDRSLADDSLLARLPALRALELRACHRLPACLSELTGLEELSLRGLCWEGAPEDPSMLAVNSLPPALRTLPRLTRLGLSSRGAKEVVAALAGVAQLRLLGWDGQPIELRLDAARRISPGLHVQAELPPSRPVFDLARSEVRRAAMLTCLPSIVVATPMLFFLSTAPTCTAA